MTPDEMFAQAVQNAQPGSVPATAEAPAQPALQPETPSEQTNAEGQTPGTEAGATPGQPEQSPAKEPELTKRELDLLKGMNKAQREAAAARKEAAAMRADLAEIRKAIQPQQQAPAPDDPEVLSNLNLLDAEGPVRLIDAVRHTVRQEVVGLEERSSDAARKRAQQEREAENARLVQESERELSTIINDTLNGTGLASDEREFVEHKLRKDFVRESLARAEEIEELYGADARDKYIAERSAPDTIRGFLREQAARFKKQQPQAPAPAAAAKTTIPAGNASPEPPQKRPGESPTQFAMRVWEESGRGVFKP